MYVYKYTAYVFAGMNMANMHDMTSHCIALMVMVLPS
jgi:hypothetical protein